MKFLTLNKMVSLLIKKQEKFFDKIMKELNDYDEKVGHWAWWIWPTERKGFNEPGRKTCVKKEEIPFLLKNTDVKKWTKILNKINKLVEVNKSFEEIIPEIDHTRIEYFFDLFLNSEVKSNKRFFNSIRKQKELYYKF
jgi:hypothetical protein